MSTHTSGELRKIARFEKSQYYSAMNSEAQFWWKTASKDEKLAFIKKIEAQYHPAGF